MHRLRAPCAILLSCLFTACGGAQTSSTPAPVATETIAPKPVEPGGGIQGVEASTETSGAPVARNPKIMELAKAALDCKVEDEAFDEECAAYKAWTENEELFEEGKGDATILGMLEDPDSKVRLLAVAHGFSNAKALFADKGRASRLFAIAKNEKSSEVADLLGMVVANVDAEKLGLADELRALAKHPEKRFRESLAFYLLGKNQTPLNLGLVTLFIEDPERRVRENAIGSLGGITTATEPVCQLLAKQLARTDDLIGKALWTAGNSRCKGIHEEVAAVLTKRVVDPSKVTNAVGIGYTLAVGAVCGSAEASADAKKKAFEVARKLVDSKVPDPNTRASALGALATCDPAAAEKLVSPLTKDKDKFVAERAAKELEQIKKANSKGKAP